MSDKPEGPGWWIASDGKWYPPELHPSFKHDSHAAPATMPSVPHQPHQAPVEQAPVEHAPVRSPAGPTPGATQPHHWQGQAQGREEKGTTVGRQFPDLFQKAIEGSHLADNITVKYDGDDQRNEPRPAGQAPSGTMRKMTPGAGVPVAAGTAGVTFAAPAKRKSRKGR